MSLVAAGDTFSVGAAPKLSRRTNSSNQVSFGKVRKIVFDYERQRYLVIGSGGGTRSFPKGKVTKVTHKSTKRG